MKATFTNRAEKFTLSHRRENTGLYHQYTGVVFDGTKIHESVIVRLYHTDSRAYACVWVYGQQGRDEHFNRHGSDYAGGYGYHKASAAVGGAIQNCGIDLDKEIEGRGDSAICESIKAIMAEIWAGNDTAINTMNIIEAHA